jgi:type VII secretion integral membrane protein EccD
VTVDVALPAGMPVAALLPAIVEFAGRASSESPRAWRLDRIGGPTLDESITLADNDVHDGDVLVLARSKAPPLGLLQWDSCQTVADAGPSSEAGSVRTEVTCAWVAVVGSLALCSGTAGQSTFHLLIAMIGTCTAGGFAIASRSAATGLASVPLAAAAGFLAVPSGPGAANVFLAAVAAATTSLLMLRWIDDRSSTLAATACVSTLVAGNAVAPVIGPVPITTVGAALAIVALGALAISGRISILLSGLAPDRQADGADARAVRGHAALTGLVAGCSVGAALGVVLVAVGCRQHDASGAAGAGFGAVVALVLLLRVRTHTDAPRRWALTVAGMVGISTVFVIVVTTLPNQVPWACVMLVTIGLGSSRPARFAAAGRAFAVLEYAALFAVVPLACWVGGVYAMVRGTQLS